MARARPRPRSFTRTSRFPTPAPFPRPSRRPRNELRQRLVEALAGAQTAQDAVHKATAAHRRAVELLQTRKQQLQSLDDLEAEITEHTIAVLRGGDGRAELSPPLQDKIVSRERSRMGFAASDAALLRLADELHTARNKLTGRTLAVNKALVPLLGLAADGFVRDIRGHEAEIARLQAKQLGFDRLASTADAPMPEAVRTLLFDQARGRVGTAQEFAVWQTAANALRADPQAEVEIAEPPRPPPPPKRAPASYQVPHVREVLAAQAKAREQAQEPPSTPEAA
jgi:hypothetical protein